MLFAELSEQKKTKLGGISHSESWSYFCWKIQQIFRFRIRSKRSKFTIFSLVDLFFVNTDIEDVVDFSKYFAWISRNQNCRAKVFSSTLIANFLFQKCIIFASNAKRLLGFNRRWYSIPFSAVFCISKGRLLMCALHTVHHASGRDWIELLELVSGKYRSLFRTNYFRAFISSSSLWRDCSYSSFSSSKRTNVIIVKVLVQLTIERKMKT